MTLDKEKVRAAISEFESRLASIPYHTDGTKQTEVLLQAARAWLEGQKVGTPVEIYDLCAKWAENDRLWSTQETVELSLRSFAYEVLRLQAKPDSDMVLVPREPTQEILDAMDEQYMPFGEMAAAYDAMMTAAEGEKKDE